MKKLLFIRAFFFAPTLMAVLFASLFLPNRISAQLFCEQEVTQVVTSANMSNLFPGGGSWPAGSSIGVSGTLTVDQSTTFTTLTFIMGPGASIKVQGNGVVLTATGTQFYACGPQMWEGITIRDRAAIAFTSVTVREAWIGLNFASGAHGTATSMLGCGLYNNMIGIQIYGAPLFRPTTFANVRIERQLPKPILLPPPGKSYSGSRLIRGIYIISSTVDLATGATQRNRIEGYRYGIWNFVSTVTVANMNLWGQVSDPILTDSIDGTDIFSWRSNLNVGGTGSTNCFFFNADNSSIISKSTRSLSVSGATFDSPKLYGVRCVQSVALSAPIRILDNRFDMNTGAKFSSAIYVERPPSGPSATNVDIERNTIKRNGGHDKGRIVMIDVQGKVPAGDITLISDNPIDIDRNWPHINGIRVTGKGMNYRILDNKNLTWDLNGSPPYPVTTVQSRGIIANDLMDGQHLITGNTVTSTLSGAKSYLRAGIFMENNPLAVNLCENITNLTHKGIECRGNLGATIMTKNSMGPAAYGLYCEAGNSMPNQDRQENIWTAASYFNWGALYNAASAPFRFFVDPSTAISNDKPPTFLPANWFVDLAGSNPSSCGVAPPFLPIGRISDYEQGFINGSTQPNSTAKNWDTRQRLLYKLFQVPELLTGDPAVSNYFYANQTGNTSPYRFAEAERLFDQAYTLSPTLASQFVSASTQVQILSDQIKALDQQQAQDSTTYDLAIAQQRAAAFDLLNTEVSNLDSLRAQADPGVQQGLQTALSYALALPEAMPYEDNLKDILVIAIRSAMGKTLMETDYARLRQIADQCPSIGGISVRRAPQWLEHEEGIDYSDKDWDYGCAATYYSNEGDPNTLQRMLPAPNPANEYLQVSFPEKAGGEWQVSDAVGRIVQKGILDIPSLGFDTQDWKPGFYFLVWKDTQGRVETSKFTIAH